MYCKFNENIGLNKKWFNCLRISNCNEKSIATKFQLAKVCKFFRNIWKKWSVQHKVSYAWLDFMLYRQFCFFILLGFLSNQDTCIKLQLYCSDDSIKSLEQYKCIRRKNYAIKFYALSSKNKYFFMLINKIIKN